VPMSVPRKQAKLTHGDYKPQRDGKGRFLTSGNPSGYGASYRNVINLCREHTPEAVAALLDVMRNDIGNGSARVAAAKFLIERGWGKAVQPVDIRETVKKMTNKELLSRAREVIRKMDKEGEREDIEMLEGGGIYES